MTVGKKFKRKVRELAEEMGLSYTAARDLLATKEAETDEPEVTQMTSVNKARKKLKDGYRAERAKARQASSGPEKA